MIQGYFRSTGSVKRPYVNGAIHLPEALIDNLLNTLSKITQDTEQNDLH